MKRYRLVYLGWQNDTHPYFISKMCIPKNGIGRPVWQQISPNYFSEGWARRWARKHNIVLEN